MLPHWRVPQGGEGFPSTERTSRRGREVAGPRPCSASPALSASSGDSGAAWGVQAEADVDLAFLG